MLLSYLISLVRRLIFVVKPDLVVHRFWKQRGRDYKDEEISSAYRLMYEEITDLCLQEKPERVLEYGCGYGYMSKLIFERGGKDRGIEFYGVDYSPAQIENARGYFSEGRFSVCDITRPIPEFSEGLFDVVTGVGVLMYIQPDRINNVVRELYRVCGKKLFAAEYYYKYLSPEKQSAYEKAFYSDGRRIYDYERLFEGVGFRNVRTVSFPSFTDPSVNTKNEMPQFLIIAEK